MIANLLPLLPPDMTAVRFKFAPLLGGTFQLDVDIPANVTATVILPGGERHEVGSGRRSFTSAWPSERELVRARTRAQV